jgi:hypothetical protein
METTTFPGIRKPEEILAELERRRKDRVDAVIESIKIKFQSVGNELQLLVHGSHNQGGLCPLTSHAQSQLFELIGLPQRTRLFQWLMRNSREFPNRSGNDPDTNHGLLCELLNEFFSRMKFDRLVRRMKRPDGSMYCRAMLSNRYRIVDSHDLFFAILEELSKVKVGGKPPEIWNARLSEDHFYGYAVAPGLTGQVDLTRTFRGARGQDNRWQGLAGDTYNGAIVFGNSETGAGGIFIRQAVVRSVSRAYLVDQDLVAERHVGGKMEADADLSAETIAAWNKAFFSEVQDHVRNAFDPEKFKIVIDRLNGAARDNVEDGVVATEALQVCYDLTEASKERIRNMFFRSGDLTRYGLVTALSEAAAEGVGAEEAVAMEQAGNDLTRLDMAEVYKRAASVRALKSPEIKIPAAKKVARRRLLEPVG